MRFQKILSLAALTTLIVVVFGDLNAIAQKPNVVIILADDLGIGDPQCYNEQSKIPTPSIDRLAREGTRFTDAHSPSSVCTPTRYGLLTGRYCWRTKLKSSVLWPWDPPLINEKRLTMGKMLQDAGYQTACIGKWHLGWDWPLTGEAGRSELNYISDEFEGYTIPKVKREGFGQRIDFTMPTRGGPTDRGFDYYFGDDVPNFPPYTFIENRQVAVVPDSTKPAKMFGHVGPALASWDLSEVMPTITDRAVAYIEKRGKQSQGTLEGDSEKPFFLFFTLTAPHTPIAPADEYMGKSQAGRYGDFVHQVDATVGKVLDALDRTGMAKNTLVIFTSDNGSPQRDGTQMSGPTGSVKKKFGHDPSYPFRGMKSDIWEAGHRVPFVIRWPGKVPKNKVSGEPMIHTDIIRSLATIIDTKLNLDDAVDSFDMSQVWLGKRGRESGDFASVRDHLIHHSGQGVFSIRIEKWKLILGKGSGGFTRFQPATTAPAGQLYDLQSDPAEATNLYSEQPKRVAEMRQRFQAIKNATTSFTRRD